MPAPLLTVPLLVLQLDRTELLSTLVAHLQQLEEGGASEDGKDARPGGLAVSRALLAAEGTILLHINFAAKNDAPLAKAIIDLLANKQARLLDWLSSTHAFTL